MRRYILARSAANFNLWSFISTVFNPSNKCFMLFIFLCSPLFLLEYCRRVRLQLGLKILFQFIDSLTSFRAFIAGTRIFSTSLNFLTIIRLIIIDWLLLWRFEPPSPIIAGTSYLLPMRYCTDTLNQRILNPILIIHSLNIIP